jgi:hypothetical protein
VPGQELAELIGHGPFLGASSARGRG